ncbi:terminase gpA endonuclease subunit [Parvibaculum sp.]|uniref:phage terminase large subunit family protein n=1 Tax=Parvibaculum sp. TaxID=2024848 RepID=UPI001DA30139|nr:terminase gpA endonuclease subunit [Parvibaculum sp.]MBX3488879.1 phage terminase large subunit family protein [Parvibaculum sp.]
MLNAETLHRQFPGLAHGREIVARSFATSLRPPPDRSVAGWSEAKRHVAAESGSPFPGKWSNDLAPYLSEPMACLSPSHPATDVTLKWSAQTGKTSVGENFFGFTADEDPAPMLIVLPSLDEAKKFVRLKLQPAIDATPALRHKVAEQKSRDEAGSTSSFKRFRGGFAQITGATSSKGLQMISVRRLWGDEISEWPADVDKRGDPLDLAIARTKAWARRGVKRLWSSTPGMAGECRISDRFDASDQRRYYVPCPHCGHRQLLRFENLKPGPDGSGRGAHFVCAANGCVIEHSDKRGMVALGRWIKCYPGTEDNPAPPPHFAPEETERWLARRSGGRQPGFHLWQAYSPFVAWEEAIDAHLAAKGKPLKERVFSQQVLGEAHEEKGEAPDHDKLLKAVLPYRLQSIPLGGLVLTMGADVQVNRLEWAVYAWGVGLSYWLVDFGIIEGDPDTDGPWRALDTIRARTYENVFGRAWGIEAAGVDSGYKSQRVYNYARARPNVLATDGRDGWNKPVLGLPKRVDVKQSGKSEKHGAMLWPVGTFTAKSELYGSLRKTIGGPDDSGMLPLGAGHFPDVCDENFFKQLTAESLVLREKRDGGSRREWVKPKDQPNEQLDIWVIARAMAYHMGLDHYTRDQWQRLIAKRMDAPEELQADLARFWSPKPGDDAGGKAAREKYLETMRRAAQALNS